MSNSYTFQKLYFPDKTAPVEHPLRDRDIVGSNPGRAIPKALTMVPVATLLGAQHYKASTDFSSPNNYCTTNFASLTNIKSPEKCLIIFNVCIHLRTVWKIGGHSSLNIDCNYYYYLLNCDLLVIWFSFTFYKQIIYLIIIY